MQAVRQELIPKVKGLCQWYAKRPEPTPSRTSKTSNNLAANDGSRKLPTRIDIIAIGVSTGGPNALVQILPNLPADLPVPIVIVQHMPPVFTKHLADRLNANSSIQVHEGQPGYRLLPGTAWIAPGNFHMTVEKRGGDYIIATDQEPPENSCRPAVDPLFRSVANIYGANVLACVLTGMGQDGTRGCEVVRDAGGMIMAQDEATSVVWGMPRAVVHAGLADSIKPLDAIASEMTRLCNRDKSQFRFTKPMVNL
jgi:two-component system chemotaxis response regulator CheB